MPLPTRLGVAAPLVEALATGLVESWDETEADAVLLAGSVARPEGVDCTVTLPPGCDADAVAQPLSVSPTLRVEEPEGKPVPLTDCVAQVDTDAEVLPESLRTGVRVALREALPLDVFTPLRAALALAVTEPLRDEATVHEEPGEALGCAEAVPHADMVLLAMAVAQAVGALLLEGWPMVAVALTDAEPLNDTVAEAVPVELGEAAPEVVGVLAPVGDTVAVPDALLLAGAMVPLPLRLPVCVGLEVGQGEEVGGGPLPVAAAVRVCDTEAQPEPLAVLLAAGEAVAAEAVAEVHTVPHTVERSEPDADTLPDTEMEGEMDTVPLVVVVCAAVLEGQASVPEAEAVGTAVGDALREPETLGQGDTDPETEAGTVAVRPDGDALLVGPRTVALG